jgi:hypothetical protein
LANGLEGRAPRWEYRRSGALPLRAHRNWPPASAGVRTSVAEWGGPRTEPTGCDPPITPGAAASSRPQGTQPA